MYRLGDADGWLYVYTSPVGKGPKTSREHTRLFQWYQLYISSMYIIEQWFFKAYIQKKGGGGYIHDIYGEKCEMTY